MRYFASMIEAANAFAKIAAPFKTIVYDDGCHARELDRREQRLLENVCAKLGYDVEEIGGVSPVRLCLEPVAPTRRPAGAAVTSAASRSSANARARREATTVCTSARGGRSPAGPC